MQELKQKHEQAKKALQAAITKLEDARRAFESGAGREYANVQTNAAALQAHIDEQKRSATAGKGALAVALKESSGAINEKAKSALAERRNAEDLLEQFQILAAEIDAAKPAILADASAAATAYISAYNQASNCLARLNVLAVVLECGEKVAHAMNVKPPVISLPHDFANGLQGEPTCKELMLDELRQLCAAVGDCLPPAADMLGQVDLGALAWHDILSPIAISKARAGGALYQ